LRDYATEAFRYYARCGCPSYEEAKKAIYDYALEASRRDLIRVKGITKPTEHAIINAQAAVDQLIGQLEDIKAVEQSLAIMRPEWMRAVELVYFTDADAELDRGDIENRVIMAELAIPASRRAIYRWLRSARIVFAVERGLRLPDENAGVNTG
jgi:hypothetical protein